MPGSGADPASNISGRATAPKAGMDARLISGTLEGPKLALSIAT